MNLTSLKFASVLLLLATLTLASANDEATLSTMRDLAKERQWKELIAQFKNEDLAAWQDASPETVAAAASLRAKAYAATGDAASAVKDLKFAIERAPKIGDYWHELAGLYRDLLKDDELALEAYNEAYERSGSPNGWLSLSSTLGSASILLQQGKTEAAQKVMARYDGTQLLEMPAVWGDKLRALNEEIAEKLSGALLTIANHGASDYQIVLPDGYPSPEIGADMVQVARLVQTAFKANGSELAVVAEAARDTAKPAIYLGDTAFARSHGIDVRELAGWSYVHRAVGRDIIITGRDETAPGRNMKGASRSSFDRIGTAKAVTDFLQTHVGVRFLFPDNGSFAPLAKVANVDLLNTPAIEYLPMRMIAVTPNLDVKKTPVLDYDITWPPVVSFYHLAQNRFPAIDALFGGHTWHRAVPCEAADFDAHPERFALLGGKRIRTGSQGQIQFCASNTEVQEMLYQDLVTHFEAGFKNVDLGQPDGFRGCECEACTKLYDTGSDWSEKVWILHRNLAERAYKDYPDRIVTISVYAITETLPKTFTSFPPNVQLGLCGTSDAEIAEWKKFGAPQGFSSYLYYWCPNMMPRYFPMRTPLYVENAAKRLMAAKVHSISRDGNGGIAHGLEGPTYYTMGKMFDGPDAHTAKRLVLEYVNAAYGKARPAMMSFYDQLYGSLELYSRYMATREDGWAYRDMYGRKRKHLGSPESIIAFLYPVDLINAMEKQLALAEKTDTSAKVQTRLALVRREFDYLKGVVTNVHLYNASQVSPDLASLDRLLNGLDSWRASVDQLFAKGAELKGWPYPLFPPPGHNADHLKLMYDGYQEPYKSSFLNWDTAAKRQAPLPNAKQIIAGPAKDTVSHVSSEWDKLQAQKLSSIGDAQPLPTQVRALFDESHLYLLFDNELPPEATVAEVEKERVEAYLKPVADSPITYRFTAGLKPDSRAEAARGLIEDLLDLGYGKFDPLWKAEWTHSATHDPQANRLTVMMTIPLSSIPNAAGKLGENWAVNFQRTSPSGKTCVWSVIPGEGAINDPRGYGEMYFGGVAASSAATKLKALREKSYLDTFEIPSQWKDTIAKGPTLALTGWRFRADPSKVGDEEQWYNTARSTAAEWTPIKVPAYWDESETIGELLGNGWYRVAFALPPDWKGKGLRLMFAGVDEQAWIYLNDKLIGEHSESSEKKAFTALYDEPFIIEVPAEQLKSSGPNQLCVRVHNQRGAGGIWRPVQVIGTSN